MKVATGIRPIDWVAVVSTLVLAAVTLYVDSFPIAGTVSWLLLVLAWTFVGIVWSASLLWPVPHNRLLFIVPIVFMIFGVLGIATFGAVVFVAMALAGLLPILVGLVGGLFLFGMFFVLNPGRRLGWMISPAVVAITVVVLWTGAPRLMRFALAEPDLTAYAEQVASGAVAPPSYGDASVVIGGIPIYEGFVEGSDVRFVTEYVGILADDGAGILYRPNATPGADRLTEHLMGPWYRWVPY